MTVRIDEFFGADLTELSEDCLSFPELKSWTYISDKEGLIEEYGTNRQL